MKIQYGWFNSKNHDRIYDSDMWDKSIGYLVSDGVWRGDGLEVTADPDNVLTLRVAPGDASIRGKVFSMEEDPTDAVPFLLVQVPPAVSQPYKGRVVLYMQNDKSDDSGRLVSVLFRPGAESNNPVPPALTRSADGTEWEICLAEATIHPTTAVITDSQIKDTRYDYTVCGIADFAPNPKISPVLAQGFTQSVFLWNCTLPASGWVAVNASEYPDHAGEWVQRYPATLDDRIYADMGGFCDLTYAEKLLDKPAPLDAIPENGQVAIFYADKPGTSIAVDIQCYRSGVNLDG